MIKILRGFIAFLLILAVLSALTYFFLPWKSFLEGRLIAMIYQRGFQNVGFNIKEVGLDHAVLSNVVLGKENPLVLKSIELKYSPRELMSGKLQDIVLSDMTFKVTQSGNGWVFTGGDVLHAPETAAEKTPVDIPAILTKLPFSSLSIENSRLVVAGDGINGEIPFTASLTDRFTLTTETTRLETGENALALGAVELVASPNDDGSAWQGAWKAESIAFSPAYPVPAMKATGTVSLQKNRLGITADLSDSGSDYSASAKASFDISDAAKNEIRITKASFPFKGGRVSTRNVVVKQPMTIPLTVHRVSINELMSSLTKDRVTATGTVSGSVPVIIAKDGSFSFGKGAMKADSAGTIQMSAELIPSDQQQVALVREILENLNYSLLSAEVQSGQGGKMTVKLSLEGNNPKVYNGRAVKLNINLTGDVLDFIQQNIMLFNNPEKLLETKSP
jgi:hypothetical protein